jgi:hypothetical protein
MLYLYLTCRLAATQSCYSIVDVLRESGYVAQVKDSKNCLIFDEGAFKNDAKPMNNAIKQFCGPVSEILMQECTIEVLGFVNNLSHHIVL